MVSVYTVCDDDVIVITSPCSVTATHPRRGSSYCLRDTVWGVDVFMYSDTSVFPRDINVKPLRCLNPDVLDLIVGVCV